MSTSRMTPMEAQELPLGTLVRAGWQVFERVDRFTDGDYYDWRCLNGDDEDPAYHHSEDVTHAADPVQLLYVPGRDLIKEAKGDAWQEAHGELGCEEFIRAEDCIRCHRNPYRTREENAAALRALIAKCEEV